MAYFPNGSAGEVLDEQCANCPYGEKPCPVYAVHMEYNYKQVNNSDLRKAMELLVSENGVCQMRELILKERGQG